MLILSPLIRLNTIILQILQGCSSKGTALGDNLSTCIILNTLRSHTFCKCKQLVYEDILQVITLCLILLINLSKNNLILLL